MFGLIGVSTWATGHVSIVPVIQGLLSNPSGGTNPWLMVTLFDAYFGFLWFWLWVAYKEGRWAGRLLWLALILLLGNLAMAAYMLLVVFRLPPKASMSDLLLRPR